MQADFDNFIEDLSQATIKTQEFSFYSHREAQLYLAQTRQKIRSMLDQGGSALIKGLQALAQHQGDAMRSHVAGVARKLLKNLDSGKQLNRIIEHEVLGNDNSLRYFCESASDFSDCSDYEVEACVMYVLIVFFSGNAQPYVYLGTMLWRREGIAVAQKFYSRIVKVIHDPALDYFAADCLIKSGHHFEAQQLLQQSLNNRLITTDNYRHVRQQIIELMATCGNTQAR